MSLVVYPTDTVWGIGGAYLSQESVERVAKVKNAPEGKPTSLMFSNVSQVREFFDLPIHFSDEWLVKFYELETSLALPKAWLKKELPVWVIYDSEFVSTRMLNLDWIDSLYRELNGPFTSTSLNLSGDQPILDLETAKKFHLENCSDAKFEEGLGKKLSGQSSTMVCFQNNEKWVFWRKGNRVKEVEEHLGLLST